MSDEDQIQLDQRLLLLTPTSRDARLTQQTLSDVFIECKACADVRDLCREIEAGAGAVLIPEEIFAMENAGCLAELLIRQPKWSDLPLLVLTRSGADSPESLHALRTMGNVVLLERPLRLAALVSTVQSALRARRRQYEIRDYLLQREKDEQELRRARTAAEHANKAKDDFLAALSHELRTPLSPILMVARALERSEKLPSEFREDMSMIARNAELEAKLIDDLLDLTRITRGKLELQTEVVDVHATLAHAVETCRSEIHDKGLRLNVITHAKEHHVWGDPGRLQQVFWNLLKNAVKFTPSGGSVEIRTINQTSNNSHNGAEQPNVIIEITDTGIGIEAGVLPKIFDAFEQGSRSITRQFGGLGLGLAICKVLLDKHAATLTALSPGKDRGSTFRVEMKTVHARANDPRSDNSPRANNNAAAPLRILLVEDHEHTGKVLARLLQSVGHDVIVADSVASAIDEATKKHFDLVISDLGLPDGSGHDLMRRLKAAHDLDGICLSGYGMEEDVARSLDAGFREHLTKPVNFEQLRAAVDRAATTAARR